MALSQSVLLKGLTGVGQQSTALGAASAWVAAFSAYTATAQDVSGDPLLVANLAAFQTQLVSLFTQDATWLANHPGQKAGAVTPTDAATAFGNAFVSYWTGATFAVAIPVAPATAGTAGAGTQVFAQEITSLVTLASPANLIASLTKAFLNPTGDTATALGRIASAFHTASTSDVTVLITGVDTTPTTPLPVTNTNTVY